MIKPAYSVSFLLSINIFAWQNVLYFLDAPLTYFAAISSFYFLQIISTVPNKIEPKLPYIFRRIKVFLSQNSKKLNQFHFTHLKLFQILFYIYKYKRRVSPERISSANVFSELCHICRGTGKETKPQDLRKNTGRGRRTNAFKFGDRFQILQITTASQASEAIQLILE